MRKNKTSAESVINENSQSILTENYFDSTSFKDSKIHEQMKIC